MLAASAHGGPLIHASQHTSTDYCSGNSKLSAKVQDRLLRFAAAAQQVLEDSGQPLALIARSGLDLQRFGHRYSHAGLTLREGADLPWAVRQLYYACDEKRPRLYDQGLPGFVFGTDRSETSFLSIVLFPEGPARGLVMAAALDKALATGLVGERYSANAHAFSTRYQNCNQWVAELLGLAWHPGGLAQLPSRALAQQSLRQLQFEPQPTIVDSAWVMWAAEWVPLIHLDDHPEQDRQTRRLQISMPSNIEFFVRQIHPQAQRIELCQTEGRIVIRRGWKPLPDLCVAEPGDQVLALD